MKQQTLARIERYGKATRRVRFLADMQGIAPWPELTAVVEVVIAGCSVGTPRS